jgi:hypothetical protein
MFLEALVPAAALVAGAAAVGLAESPQALPPQQPPGHLPPGREPPTLPDADLPKVDKKALLKDNQKQIHEDVERLYTLASELKEEVAKTDSTAVLSLALVRKAEEIEKLAKQIKNLART